jgi:hypothetical protein
MARASFWREVLVTWELVETATGSTADGIFHSQTCDGQLHHTNLGSTRRAANEHWNFRIGNVRSLIQSRKKSGMAQNSVLPARPRGRTRTKNSPYVNRAL